MRLLELFSGTKSVGKVAEALGYEVVSLDLKDADINCDILNWDYMVFEPRHFDVIWASPPCDTFSKMKLSRIGRNGCTKDSIQSDIDNIGLPILRRTEQIIEYLQPNYYFIENPQSGKMKYYITDKPFYDVDYCKYANWGYRKRTRIWTNLQGFIPKLCKKDCNSMTGTRHKINIGHQDYVRDGDTIISLDNRELRSKYKHHERIQEKRILSTLKQRYRIPPNLINELLQCVPME